MQELVLPTQHTLHIALTRWQMAAFVTAQPRLGCTSPLQAPPTLMQLPGFWAAVCRQLAWSVGRATHACIHLDRCPPWYWEERHQNSLPATAGVAKPPSNIGLCSDSHETRWADDCNYAILLPDLDNGRCPLYFVLQNLFLWLSQSQWVQIQWEKSLGIFVGTNAHQMHCQTQFWTRCCCWKLGSSFKAISRRFIKDVQTSK